MSVSGLSLVGVRGRRQLAVFSHSGSQCSKSHTQPEATRTAILGPSLRNIFRVNPFILFAERLQQQEALFPSSLLELLAFRPLFSSAIATLTSDYTIWVTCNDSDLMTMTETVESQ